MSSFDSLNKREVVCCVDVHQALRHCASADKGAVITHCQCRIGKPFAGNFTLHCVGLGIPSVQHCWHLAGPNWIADGVNLVLPLVALHTTKLHPLENIFDTSRTLPPQLCMLFTFLHIPHYCSLVLTNTEKPCTVWTEVNVIDLLLVGCKIVHLGKIRKTPDPEVAIIPSCCQQF